MTQLDRDGSISEFVQWRPAPPLRPFIAWYSGYRQAGIGPGHHRGLPSPYLTMIITLDDPLVLAAHPDPKAPAGRYDTLIGGLHTAPALITHDGRQSGLQLALSPLGARALLGLPAGELANADLDAADVLGPFAQRLRERILAGAGWADRFAALDALLSHRLGAPPEPRAEVTWAWQRLARHARHDAGGGTGPRGGLEQPAPEPAVPGRDRAQPEGRRAGGALRPYPPGVAAADRRRAAADAGRRWPRPAATTTRHTSRGSSASSPAAHRASGSPRSSETSKPSPPRPRKTSSYDGQRPTAAGLAHPRRPGRARADPVPGDRLRLRGDRRLRRRRPGRPRRTGLAAGWRDHARQRPGRSRRRTGRYRRAPSAGTWSPTTRTHCSPGRPRPAPAVLRELHDTDYGSRDFAVLDPEGNRWSFGTYRGAPRTSSAPSEQG